MFGNMGYGFNRATVKESLIHDKGVFATVNICKNEIITLYPTDFIVDYSNGKAIHSLNNEPADFVKNEKLLNKYSVALNSNVSFVGQPKLTNNSDFVGHMINEGSKCFDDEKQYSESAEINCNCKFVPITINMMLACVATRNINQGEEILVAYTFKYWHDNPGYLHL